MKSQFLSTFTKLSHSKLPYITNKTSPNRQVNLTINTSRSNKSLSPKTKTKRRILKTAVSAIETEDQHHLLIIIAILSTHLQRYHHDLLEIILNPMQ